MAERVLVMEGADMVAQPCVESRTGLSGYAEEARVRDLKAGMRDGLPISLGYLAVSFSLGITASVAGLSPLQACLASLLCNASAGEYAGFALMVAGSSYLELALVTLVTNARYLLMSCALSQRFSAGTSLGARLLVAFDNADELFALNVTRPGDVSVPYALGAMAVTMPGWAGGTFLGAIAGSVLPELVVEALGASLFGMFLAVIVPPARQDRVVGGVVVASFAASLACSLFPVVSSLSSGTRTILLTVAIAGVAAALFPVEEAGDNPADDPAESEASALDREVA